ncbi:MAG: formylglycine-generating enzyme family protein, partial [Candidatus Electryoneaceae bacterium]|nr:formylglycine-generating enzyme family protein [Candidatus Electryoneaceae bacterium]
EPPSIVSQDQATATYDPGELDYEQTYYWKVVAKDDHDHSVEGSVWSFATSGPGNQPPNAPSDPSPSDEAVDQQIDIDISWSCSDPDGDPLIYDVYFCDSEDPPLVSEDQQETTYQPDELDYEQTYYWKVVAKDDHDHVSERQVWSFTTEEDGGREEPEPGEEREFDLTDDDTITMVWIPAGSFMMGRQDNEQDSYNSEDPRHEVNINYGFWMGKYEVTQAQWEAVTGNNPSHFEGNNRPVEQVSWDDIYEDFLSQIDEDFRLPSESEREYACRAGTETRFYWGNDPDYDEIGDYAWYTSNSNSQTHEVGQKRPNAFGLYDISGNVYEWCEDAKHDNYIGAPDDGSAWGGDYEFFRVVRDGCWDHGPRYCRSASRRGGGRGERLEFLGFRLVLVR